MTAMQMIFLITIALVTLVRISLFPRKGWLTIILLWGMLTIGLTYYMSGVTQDEIYSILGSKTLAVCESIELMLFVAIVFSSGKSYNIVRYYPGLMIIAPIACMSSIASRSFTGLDFIVSSLFAGVLVWIVSAFLIMLCRFVRLGNDSLYKISLTGIIICTIYYGIQ